MLVSLWMTRDPVVVAPEATISDATLAMSRRRIRRLPVARHGHLVGIVTSHDLARAYPPDVNPFSVVTLQYRLDRPVADLMTRAPRTVTPATPIEEAARLLREHKIGAMPVVSGDTLVGIITESDVFRAFLEVVGAQRPGVRILFDARENEDVVAGALAVGDRDGMRITTVLSMEHDGQRLVLVRLLGHRWEAFVEDVMHSGRRVLSVLGH